MKFHFGTRAFALSFVFICQVVFSKRPPPSPPRITEEPKDALVKGTTGTVRLYCRAEGNPEPRISWYKDGTLLTDSDFQSYHIIKVSGEGGLLLYKIVSKGEHSNLGVYQCRASNSLGPAVSRNASVQSAEIDDDFRLEPSDTVNAVGNTVTMQCEGPSGFPKPVISWKKDLIPLSVNERIEILPSGSLVIKKLMKSDSGSYECVASNMAGTVLSSSAVLMVKELPRPRIDFNQRVVTVGQNVEVICTVEGDPLARTSWTKKGGSVSERFSTSNDRTMRITGVEAEDEGTYVCTAENRVGKQSTSVEIKVQGQPVITSVSSDTRVRIGDTITLSCRARGTPAPLIMWRDFKGNNMYAENSYQSGHILIDANGDLLLFSVSKEDEGVYSCQALNLAGTATADVRLSVEEKRKEPSSYSPPPILNSVPANMSVLLASTVLLNCSSQSKPEPEIRWLKDDQPVEGVFPLRTTTLSSGSLEISDVQLSDAGKYTCRASNKNGMSEWNAWISVIAEQSDVTTDGEIDSDSPSAPGKPILIRSTPTSVTLSWSESRHLSAIDYYVIDYYRRESSSNSWKRESSAPRSSYTVAHLLPSSSYIFVVRAVAQRRISEPSPVSDVIRTDAFAAEDFPGNQLNSVSIRITKSLYDSGTPGVVALEWSSNSGCDVIDGFLITARAVTVPSTNLATRQVVCTGRSLQLSHVVAGTKYEVRVRPYKGQIIGPASPIVFISTSKGIISPASPTLSMSKVENQAGQIYFRWQPPVDLPATYVSGYVLRCWSVDGDFERRLQVNSTTHKLTLSNLPTGASYEATLTYLTQLGVGAESEETTLQLPVPEEPNPITSFLQTPVGIIVISAAALVIILVVVIGVCCFIKSRKNCKSRNHRGSRTSNNYHQQQATSKEGGLGSNGDGFELERVSILQPGSNGPGGSSAIYYQNGDISTHLGSPPTFSYLDELLDKRNLPSQFSRPHNPTQSSVALQSRQVPMSRQQGSNCTNQGPLESPMEEDLNNPAGFQGAYTSTNFPPPAVSPPSTHKTGASDRSQSSSGIRSASDKSSHSGQSSRYHAGPCNVTSRKPLHGQDVNSRLHGSQQAYQNTSQASPAYEEIPTLKPPTPPIREESYHTFDEQYQRNYENLVISSKLPHQGYPTNPQHTNRHDNTKAVNGSWGNGYGSEMDDRDSSCERVSSASSGDESFEMESVSQVGQNRQPDEKPRPYYRPPQFNPALTSQVSTPYSYSNSDQEPLLPLTFHHNPTTESTNVADAPPHTHSSNIFGSTQSQAVTGNPGSNPRSTGSNPSVISSRPKIPSSKNTGPMTLELPPSGQFSSQNEVPESLKLDINNALMQPRLRDDPSPSSPTESGISDQSGYMSTASSCWQFQRPSPTKPFIQHHPSSAGSNGRPPTSYYSSNGPRLSQRNNLNNNNNNNHNKRQYPSSIQQPLANKDDNAVLNPVSFPEKSGSNVSNVNLQPTPVLN